jgi:hypothetical protein
MACTNCKKTGNVKKEKIKKEIVDSVDGSEKSVIIFMIIWTLLAIYGIYSLIVNFI